MATLTVKELLKSSAVRADIVVKGLDKDPARFQNFSFAELNDGSFTREPADNL